MSGDPRLLAVGLASPATRLSRDAGLRLAARISPDADRERLAELYANAGVSERGSILGDGGECADLLHTDAPQGPTTAARLARYRPHAVTLAGDASTAALARAERPPEAVTHLITVSCTGAESPGLDHALIDRLGLRSEISRTHVGFMGCHGAINGLALADAFVRAHDGALAMVVCVEVCSLHFQAQAPWDQQVANAIFADGAACAVVGGAGGRPDAPRLRAFGSRVFPGTRDLMSWTIGEHGFEMRLSPRVPGVLRRAVGPWTDQWLGALKLSRADIAAWAVHLPRYHLCSSELSTSSSLAEQGRGGLGLAGVARLFSPSRIIFRGGLGTNSVEVLGDFVGAVPVRVVRRHHRRAVAGAPALVVPQLVPVKSSLRW
jgi:predicted naringenin-chalcone synthase